MMDAMLMIVMIDGSDDDADKMMIDAHSQHMIQ
jgi:hypothetical protein